MKKHIVFTALAFAAITMNNAVHAYNFRMKNETGKKLLIQVELLGDGTPYFRYAEPNASVEFSFNTRRSPIGHCLDSIRCLVYDDNFINALNKGARIFPGQAPQFRDWEILKFLKKNEYRKNVIMKYKSGAIYHGDFCRSYNFIIRSEGDNFVATWE